MKNSTDPTVLNKKPERRKHEAILISGKDMNYADLLKTVKKSVNPGEIGAEVKDIKKTRSGNILLTVRNGYEKAEALKKKIEERVPAATTSHLANRKVIHVKDLDDISTEEDIRDAISEAIAVERDTFEVRALRPAYGQKQNVTVVMLEQDAEKLLKLGHIKIGWMACRINERIKDKKCYRCWQYGHTKASCSGPNREHNCLKCSKEGHKAKECRNETYCIYCQQEGHQTGSRKCQSKNKERDGEGTMKSTI